jgi:hypothetical protein
MPLSADTLALGIVFIITLSDVVPGVSSAGLAAHRNELLYTVVLMAGDRLVSAPFKVHIEAASD